MRDKPRTALLAVLLIASVALAFTVPVPSPAELRELAVAAGTVAPLLFFGTYAVAATLPVPRTVFSLAAGLLLGNAVGLAVAMAATAAAGAMGYWCARVISPELLSKYLANGSVGAAYDRVTSGGAWAVTYLRLIPVIPFAPLSYLCGLSTIPFRPYLAGTVLGSLPGTAAVVILGDALTGSTPPGLVLWYVALATIGALGIYRLARVPAPAAPRRVLDDPAGWPR